MNQEFIIRLEDVRFHAPIGVYENERIVGNDFRLDLAVRINADSFSDENLNTTVSYAAIYDEVIAIVNNEWLLLETVSKLIAQRVCDKWPMIEDISVKLTKLTVPIPEFQGNCSVEYRKIL